MVKISKTIKDLAKKEGIDLSKIEKAAAAIKAGRPALPDEQRRKLISLRVTDSELAEIDRRATAMGMNRSEYLIHAALKFKPRSKR